jgi:hypothetical protein
MTGNSVQQAISSTLRSRANRNSSEYIVSFSFVDHPGTISFCSNLEFHAKIAK